MAKPKKYISSKLKVKRKFILGGDTQQELYLNDNVTYQAQTPPTSLLQNQFDAQEQARAKQMSQIYGQELANQLVVAQDINQASEQRKQEEKQAKEVQNQQTVENTQKQVTAAAGIAAKDIAKTIATVGTVSKLPKGTAGPVLSRADARALGVKSASRFAGEGVSKTSYGSNLANLGVGVGLGLIGEGIGYFGNKRDDKQMEQQGRSQYYDDTHYSRAEFNSQIGKSTFKGAGMGSTFGPIGTAIGAGIGAIYGTGKALTERRRTKSEDERGVKIGNKRFGKKLLFGEENVYDENLDPTVIEKRNKEAQLKAMTDTATALDNARMGSMIQSDLNTGFNLKNTPGQMAKYGGKLEYLKGGVAKSLGRGAKEYVGKKHEQGGIDLPGNIEVEGGETEQNNYIFSATLKLPTGITYAQAHKNLLKSGASSEEIKQLALSQEAAAGRNPNEIKTMKFAKYGGPLMYREGGNTETDPPKEGELDFDAKTKMRIHANEGVYSGGLTTPYLDSKGYWTVGHGHLLTKEDGTPYTKNDKLPAEFGKITEQQVKDWAKSDYETLKQAAINWIGEDKWKQLPDSVKSGTIELAYGLGPEKLKKFDDTKKYILAGDYESAAENIANSKYFKDVAERRGTQVAALIGGDEEVFTNSASKDQYTVPKEKAIPYLTKGKQLQTTNTSKPTAIGVSPKTTVLPDGTEIDLGEDTGNTSGLTETIDRKNLRFESSDNPADEADGLTVPVENIQNQPSSIKYEISPNGKITPGRPITEDEYQYYLRDKQARELNEKRIKEGKQPLPEGTVLLPSASPTSKNSVESRNESAKSRQRIQSTPLYNDNLEENIVTEVTDAKTGEKIETYPKKDTFDPSIVPDSNYTAGYTIGSGTQPEQIVKEKDKKTTSPNLYKGLAYAAQFAQPAYALLNPYKSVYNEAPVSVDRGLSGMVPTIGTNINLGRVSPAQAIAEQQAATNAVIQQASNMGGPASAAVQLAALEKNKAGIASATNAANTANMQLAAQEANARLTASVANQRAAQNAIQLQSQLGAQQAQMDAARNARIATAKEAANSERYLNTAGAIGAAGAGIGNMYRDQTQLDTQYKVALATDPTGSAARWLQANDPNAYARYVQENATTKKFGGPKNSYISRLGELTKRPLKAKI